MIPDVMVMVVGAPSIYLLKNISLAQNKRKKNVPGARHVSSPAAAAAFLLLLPCHHRRFDVFEVRAVLVVIGRIVAVVCRGSSTSN